MRTYSLARAVSWLLLLGVWQLAAKAPAQERQPATPATRGGAGRPPAFPTRAPGDPEKIHHGQQLFGANCGFCHGSDARGGETGPNLVRSQLVLDDQDGKLISSVVENGRPAKGMPSFQLSASDISDIADYLHSLPLSSHNLPPSAPINVLVGDAEAGKAYFNGAGQCNSCHSATGDLAEIGAKYPPRILQNLIVSGGGGRRGAGRGDDAGPEPPPIAVTLKLVSGEEFRGTLVYLNTFFVVLTEQDGTSRSFPIDPKVKVEVHNPLQAHIDMLSKWNDSDIHNLTSYLSTLK